MNTHAFSYKELLKEGYEKTKEHFWMLLQLELLAIVIMFVVGHIPIVGQVMQMLIGISLTYIFLNIAKGHHPKLDQVLTPFKTYKITLYYLIGIIICLVLVGLGFILLILPGIYLVVRLSFVKYLVVDHEMKPKEALEKSMLFTKGHFWLIFGWYILLILINIAGGIALGVGLIFTIPLTGIANTYLYRKLASHHNL